MAKGNMFLGMARGKVGSVVFSRLNGKQVIRAKADTVANPKTFDQRVQRAIFATATRASKFLSSVVDHSWDGIKDGQDSVRCFSKLNLTLLRSLYERGDIRLNLNSKGVNEIMPNPYQLTSGPLHPLTLINGVNDLGSGNFTPFVLGKSIRDAESATFKDMALSFGVQAGDELSAVVIVGRVDENDTPIGCRVLKTRVIFSASVSDDAELEWGFLGANDSTVIDPSSDIPRSAESFGLSIMRDNGHLTLYIAAGSEEFRENEDILAGAIILSRYDQSKKNWVYSSQSMIVNPYLMSNAAEAISSYDNASSANEAVSENFLDGAIDTGSVSTQVNVSAPGSLDIYGLEINDDDRQTETIIKSLSGEEIVNSQAVAVSVPNSYRGIKVVATQNRGISGGLNYLSPVGSDGADMSEVVVFSRVGTKQQEGSIGEIPPALRGGTWKLTPKWTPESSWSADAGYGTSYKPTVNISFAASGE